MPTKSRPNLADFDNLGGHPHIELLQAGGALPPAEPWSSMPNTGSW